MPNHWTMTLPDSSLYDSATYVVDMSELPSPLQEMLPKATFLGRGASSAAWKLENGTVFKLTTDEAACSFHRWQQMEKKPHLPQILELGSIGVALPVFAAGVSSSWERWYFVVQPFYGPVEPHLWETLSAIAQPVGASQCKSRPGWGKTKNGLMAHGQLAHEHLVQLERVFSKEPCLAQAAAAVSMLAVWWKQARGQPGLDVDKSENWAMNNATDELVLLDPVYGNDKTTSGVHWGTEI